MSDPTHSERHREAGQKLNWLRAAVLGAGDGIVSVAALIVGVAGATQNTSFIVMAGIAGTISGALSMAVGEYVSVSTQRDTEQALIDREKYELATLPEEELEELTKHYQAKGLSRSTAETVAKELTARDAFTAHAETELRLDPDNLANPWYAAVASGLSFTVGAIIPLLTISLSPSSVRIALTFISAVIALAATGAWSAYTGGSRTWRAIIRVVLGGMLAMLITFAAGRIFSVSRI